MIVWQALSGQLSPEEKAMVIYSVRIAIDPAMEAEWMEWMRRVHIPEVLRPGCFNDAAIYKVADPAAGEPTYVIQYSCSSMKEYHRYRDQFAAGFQEKHKELFAGRFRASREILEKVAAISD
jgi:Domain of unknown function (DUF4286)